MKVHRKRPIRTPEEAKERVEEVVPYLIRRYSIHNLERLEKEIDELLKIAIGDKGKPLIFALGKDGAFVSWKTGEGVKIIFGDDGRIIRFKYDRKILPPKEIRGFKIVRRARE